MTKVKKNISNSNIQTNIKKMKRTEVSVKIFDDLAKTFDFIDSNLPSNYTITTMQLLPKNTETTKTYIRRVKSNRILNVNIITALYRIAQFNYLQKNQS